MLLSFSFHLQIYTINLYFLYYIEKDHKIILYQFINHKHDKKIILFIYLNLDKFHYSFCEMMI